jgi:hypothetical protein
MIQTTRDFIGQIWADPTNQMLRFRILQIVTICRLRALNPYSRSTYPFPVYISAFGMSLEKRLTEKIGLLISFQK